MKAVSRNDDGQSSCGAVNEAAGRQWWLDADGGRLASSYGGVGSASWPDRYVKGRQISRGINTHTQGQRHTEGRIGESSTPRHDNMYARVVREERTG